MTGEAELMRYPRRILGHYYMDVKLAGGNWQCDWGDGTCQEMEDEIDFAKEDDAERSNQFKYVFDVSYPAPHPAHFTGSTTLNDCQVAGFTDGYRPMVTRGVPDSLA